MTIPNRIVLISHGRHDELPGNGTGPYYPGMLGAVNSSSQIIAHNVAGGGGPLMVIKEDALAGLDITQHLGVSDAIPFQRPARGDLLLMLLQNGQNVAAQTPLMSAGDGTLMAALVNPIYQITAASTGITNTATPTTFSNGTYTFPANVLQAGDVIHITGKAVVSAQNSTNTHDVKVLIGATTLADCGASALAAGNFAEFDITMTVRTVGSGGTFVADVITTVNPGGTETATTSTVASTTINTTVTEAVTVTSTASAASTGNIIALQEFQISLARNGGLNVIGNSAEAVNNSGGTGTSGFNTAAFIRVQIP